MGLKNNELRIGNIIQEGKVEQIDNSIDEVYYSGDGYFQSTYCCNLNPIPLTEEWLLKLGFEKRNNPYKWYKWLYNDEREKVFILWEKENYLIII